MGHAYVHRFYSGCWPSIDVVITDMTTPNMTGDKLAMELIALRPDIPVILFSGHSKKITGEKAAEMGIRAFAYKPLVKADLQKQSGKFWMLPKVRLKNKCPKCCTAAPAATRSPLEQ